MRNNIITLTDSYKVCHANMYPEGTETVYSYFEARNGARWNETVFFGLQYLLKEYLCGQVVTREKIDQAKNLIDTHLGPNMMNVEGWEYILEKHNGYLPLKIKAIPEGTPVPINNVMMTVENTDPKCYWLTNYVESLLTHVWSASTVATLSRQVKKMFKRYLMLTNGNTEGISFMLHDFGFRGVSSVESAGFEGMGHLANFLGTDTIVAIEEAMDYYSADVCAFSVSASEHSIMTSRGEEGEKQVFKDLLDKYPTGILSIVIDSYNYRRFILEYAKEFKDQILARDGKVVFRPDSGEPVFTTIDVLTCIDHVFGSEKNNFGYSVLNPKVGALWGDGIDIGGIDNILYAISERSWAVSNMVFGMGGGLLQKINRDVQRFAFKSSAQKRNGEWFDIFKDPIDKSKTSKKGQLMLIKNDDNQFETVQKDNMYDDELSTVFLNGYLQRNYTFDQVRSNVKIF